MVEDDQIVVFGLFHCARDPRTIKAKLRIAKSDKAPNPYEFDTLPNPKRR